MKSAQGAWGAAHGRGASLGARPSGVSHGPIIVLVIARVFLKRRILFDTFSGQQSAAEPEEGGRPNSGISLMPAST